MRNILVLGAVFGLASEAAAQEKVMDLDGELFLGARMHAENITVWPVYSNKPAEKVAADLVPLAEAQEEGWASVRETGAAASGEAAPPQQAPVQVQRQARRHPLNAPMQQLDEAIQQQQAIPQQQQIVQQQQLNVAQARDGEPAGTVNELVIDNQGKKPILVLAGTLLKGGKQDRQVGQDFIVPAGKVVPVSAFCVEHGRWTATRDGQSTGGVFKAQKTLATKSVRTSGQYKGDQGDVWKKVAEENMKAGKAPGTGTLMATVEDDDQEGTARRERLIGAVKAHFAPLSTAERAPVGFAYAVDGKVREVRAFNHPVLFQRLSETFFNTIAIEADLAQREAQAAGKPVHAEAAEPAKVADLVKGAGEAAAEQQHNKAGNKVEMRKAKAGWSSSTFEDDAQAAPVTKSFMSVD